MSITPHTVAAASAAAAAFVLSAAIAVAAAAAALDAAPSLVVLQGHAYLRVDAASADSRDWICTSLIQGTIMSMKVKVSHVCTAQGLTARPNWWPR